VVALACQEYLWAANMSFAMYAPSYGHARVLLEHGTADLREEFVPRLLSGEWRAAQSGIDHQRGTLLGGVDAALEVGQPVGVPLRRVSERGHLVGHVTSPPAPSGNARDRLANASSRQP
jgi:hypothetical protein